MKRVLLIPVIAIVVVVAIGSAFSMQCTILEKRNEYGGRTEEEAYFTEDARWYQEGLARLVQYFDGNDRIIKLESFFNDNHTMMDGVERSVQYFDNRFYGTGIRTRVEFHYSDLYAALEGLARAVQFYDEDEKRTQVDYYYTDAYAKKRQTSKLEVLYDPKGNIVKRTYFDKEGRVLAVDGKK